MDIWIKDKKRLIILAAIACLTGIGLSVLRHLLGWGEQMTFVVGCVLVAVLVTLGLPWAMQLSKRQ